MALPKVTIQAAPGEAPTVLVDGVEVPGVRSAQVTVNADHIPQVSLVLNAGQVDAELPAGVMVLQAGPSILDFAEGLPPARLEQLALAEYEMADLTQGEAFAAAVRVLASEYSGG